MEWARVNDNKFITLNSSRIIPIGLGLGFINSCGVGSRTRIISLDQNKRNILLVVVKSAAVGHSARNSMCVLYGDAKLRSVDSSSRSHVCCLFPARKHEILKIRFLARVWRRRYFDRRPIWIDIRVFHICSSFIDTHISSSPWACSLVTYCQHERSAPENLYRWSSAYTFICVH